YVGFGMSWLSPHGQPTGFGGPFFVDSDTAPVWAIGLEGDYYVNPNVSIGGKVGFRHVWRTDYPTSLPGERFIFDYKNQMLAAFPVAFHTDGSQLRYLSAIRLKRDIALIEHLDNGLGLYRFRYVWSDESYVGVMAQEVAAVAPEAVMVGPDGYLRVDYG